VSPAPALASRTRTPVKSPSASKKAATPKVVSSALSDEASSTPREKPSSGSSWKIRFSTDDFVPHALLFGWGLCLVHFAGFVNSKPELQQCLASRDPFQVIKPFTVPWYTVSIVSLVAIYLGSAVMKIWSRDAYGSTKGKAADAHARHLVRLSHCIVTWGAFLGKEFLTTTDDHEYQKNALAVAIGVNVADLLQNYSGNSQKRNIILALDTALFISGVHADTATCPHWQAVVFTIYVIHSLVDFLSCVHALSSTHSNVGKAADVVSSLLSPLGAVLVLGLAYQTYKGDVKVIGILAAFLGSVAFLNYEDRPKVKS